MHIGIADTHGDYELKEHVIALLKKAMLKVTDLCDLSSSEVEP